MRNLNLGSPAFALLAVSVHVRKKNKKMKFWVNGKCAMWQRA